MLKKIWKGSLVSVVLLLGACTTTVRAPVVEKNPVLNAQTAWKVFEGVLAQHVNERGQVDFHAARAARTDLDRVVDFIGNEAPWTHPEKYATLEAQLIYFINSYNALSMYSVIEAGIPESLGGFNIVRHFDQRNLRIGGRYISLFRYENEFIRPLGDERVHFALNCMVRGCPVLSRRPYGVGGSLDQDLNREAKRFFNEARTLQVDTASKRVKVSQILMFYTRDFLVKAPNLLAYINRYRDSKIPEDYRVEFIPYDWDVNMPTK